MIPRHSNLALANQEFDWNGTDSEHRYQKNLKTNLVELERYNWVDRPIKYKFNSHGFRADEFDSPGSNILFVGCSHTLGVGLPVESTWAHIVSTSLNLKNYNISVGGSSNDTAFRLAYYWIEQLKPSLVLFLSPEKTRFELHTGDNEIFDLSVWPHAFPMVNDFMRHWHSNDSNSDMNYLKNTLAIKQLCSERGIKYIQRQAANIHVRDKARDLQHYGEKTHQRIADMFLSKI
jgi:hypothetical protein